MRKPADELVLGFGHDRRWWHRRTVTNVGPAMQLGDTFHLFPSAVTGFAAINLATADGNGKAYTWNNNIGTDGSVSVARCD